MKKQKTGQFFYIVNAVSYKRNDEKQSMLLEITKVIRKKDKMYYKVVVHRGYRLHSRLDLSRIRNFNPPHFYSNKDEHYISGTKLSAYLSNGSLEKIESADAAKMLLLGTDETYDSPSYNKLRKQL